MTVIGPLPPRSTELDEPGAPLSATARTDPAGPAPGPGRRRAPRWVLAVAGLVLLLLAAAALTFLRPSGPSTQSLHPANPGINGAQAVARVLQQQGVTVVVAEGEAALRASAPDLNTTILVSNTAQLREQTVRSLGSIAERAERLVLVTPDRPVVRQLLPAVGMRSETRQDPNLVSGCAGTDVRQGERLSRSQWAYQDPRAAERCFVVDNYAVYLRTTTTRLREVVLVGSRDVLENSRVTQLDNAAVALRTLGHSARVVWYVPDIDDVPALAAAQDEPLAPVWWEPMVLLLAFVVGGLAWWRGRRFGRLVTEPLPVVVRAAETTESRGRMYRKARDTRRAAAVLRDATRRRLAAYLGVPGGIDPERLVEAVSAATGRPVDQVRHLLTGGTPPTDADLLDLAATLAALEKEIRRS